MQCLLLVVATFSLLGNVFCQSQGPVVRVTEGQLLGFTRHDRDNNRFFSFRRIPYAIPPVGNLRFRDPLPPTNWVGIRDATTDMPYCIQKSLSGLIGQEDCLYLNVHTREFPQQGGQGLQRPVMVWIHGGLFATGSGNEDYFNPEFLMTQDIVLVTINYRLNIFGFLSIDDTTLGVPGNAGLKDQAMALSWVQRNIANFGGNPRMVTIFGQGAGAASVHYHILSPLSRGLFHRAIMQSGTALAPWTFGIRNNGLGMAHELNINTTSRVRMMETLRWLRTDQIFEGYQRLASSSSLNWGSVTNPVIERQNDSTAFLRDNPFDLITRAEYNHVPIMIGYNDAEGIALDQLMRFLRGTNESTIIHDFTQMIPPDLEIRRGTEREIDVARQIQNFYFPTGQTGNPNETTFVKMIRDVWFGFPAFRTATAHVRNSTSDVFFYRFSADTTLNVFKRRDAVSSLIPGASHEDDIGYLFRTILTPDIPPGTIEDMAIARMVNLWANFARGSSGDVSVGFHWQPIGRPTAQTGISVRYAEIGSLVTTMGVHPDEASMAFWTNIYDRYFVSNGVITKGFMLLIMVLSIFNLLI